jgi:hypothetical protein
LQVTVADADVHYNHTKRLITRSFDWSH